MRLDSADYSPFTPTFFMAADKTPDQEPSIEEILASIRQIISDDEDKDSDAPAVAHAPEPAFEPVFEPRAQAGFNDFAEEPDGSDDEDVLELTPEMEEPAAFIPDREPADIDIDLQDHAEPEPIHDIGLSEEVVVPAPLAPEPLPVNPAPQPAYVPPTAHAAPKPESAMPRPTPMPDPDDSDILTGQARAATLSSMARLAGNMPITRHREYGNITLEDLVREMLHPMLKDWLSENLPPMVERTVQRELEKLARQAQDV